MDRRYFIKKATMAAAGAAVVLMTACGQGQSNAIVAEGEKPVMVADSYSFTEGPAADAKGDVFFTDQPNNRIYRWDCSIVH